MKNRLLSKKRPIAFGVSLILLIAAAFIIFRDTSPIVTIYVPLEPEAQISTDIILTNYEASSLAIDGLSQENLSKTSIAQDKVVDATTSLISSEKYIEALKYSPDSKTTLVLSWTSDPAAAKKGDPSVTNSPTLKLALFKANGKLLKTIETENVLYAEFNTSNQIYYQKQGTDYGIFTYTIDTDTQKKFIETTDRDAFRNIAMIDEENFFFVQPKTGKYGRGKVSTGELTVEGEKAVNQDSILNLNMAVYSDLTISPDKNYIAFFDNSQSESLNRTLLMFSASDLKIDKPILETQVESIENSTDVFTKKYEWSNDSKYLTTGTDGTTINIESKQSEFKGETGKVTRVKFSPDRSKAIVCSGGSQNGNCVIKGISNKHASFAITNDIKLSKDIKDMNWLDNDTAVFVIGNSLYDYKIPQSKLEKLSTEKSDFKILERNNSKNSITIKQGDALKEVAKN